jgi:hypothetical protein
MHTFNPYNHLNDPRPIGEIKQDYYTYDSSKDAGFIKAYNESKERGIKEGDPALKKTKEKTSSTNPIKNLFNKLTSSNEQTMRFLPGEKKALMKIYNSLESDNKISKEKFIAASKKFLNDEGAGQPDKLNTRLARQNAIFLINEGVEKEKRDLNL